MSNDQSGDQNHAPNGEHEQEGTQHAEHQHEQTSGEEVNGSETLAKGSENDAAEKPQQPENSEEAADGDLKDQSTQLEYGKDDSSIKAPGSTLLPSPMQIEIPSVSSIEQITSSHGPDSPTTSLIATLRSQLTILSDQSTALNTKLIEAISRHSDLEDTHLNLQQSHKELGERAEKLAAEKARWEENMNTGLLVERSQITNEMQKLAAGLVEEERRRGSAEEGRRKVEEEVDELAATLFDQANTMVAAERMARSSAETRLKDTEDNLAAAEAAIRDMQLHLQSLPTTLNSPPTDIVTIPRRYLSSHLPYTEFLSFLSHLRALRPIKTTLFPPPALTTLISQPFIARAITEDHEPTIRLDAAPDLTYFSRRNVGPAIIAGELIIEPVSAQTVISSHTVAPHDINCSLCGKPVFPQFIPQSPSQSSFAPPPLHPQQSKSRFSLKPFFNASSPSNSGMTSPTSSPLASPSFSSGSHPPVYVFRVGKQANTTASTEKEKAYPLCKTGWCLERLRAACELWHFIRTGIIHPVWHGDDTQPTSEHAKEEREIATPQMTDRRVSGTSVALSDKSASTTTATAVPTSVSEKKKSGGWGLGFKLGSNEKPTNASASWFSRSASNTPPRSPITPASEFSADQEKEKPSALDDPINLTSSVDEKTGENGIGIERTDVPIINQVDASPAAPTKVEGEGAEEKDEESTLHPGLSRTGSQQSMTTSAGGTDENTFSTPKGVQGELPEDGGEGHAQEVKGEGEENDSKPEASVHEGEAAKANDEEADKETEEAKKENEEVKEETQAVKSEEPTPSQPQTQPTPPPIPRRAANRMSRPVPLTPSSDSPSVVAAPEPVPENTIDLTEDTPQLESEKLPQADGTEPSDLLIRDITPIAPGRSAPPLPARHPKTPMALPKRDKSEAIPIDGEKRYMRVDSEIWEEKTWRMVVKLKEGMWKARIGVTDEKDE